MWLSSIEMRGQMKSSISAKNLARKSKSVSLGDVEFVDVVVKTGVQSSLGRGWINGLRSIAVYPPP